MSDASCHLHRSHDTSKPWSQPLLVNAWHKKHPSWVHCSEQTCSVAWRMLTSQHCPGMSRLPSHCLYIYLANRNEEDQKRHLGFQAGTSGDSARGLVTCSLERPATAPQAGQRGLRAQLNLPFVPSRISRSAVHECYRGCPFKHACLVTSTLSQAVTCRRHYFRLYV